MQFHKWSFAVPQFIKLQPMGLQKKIAQLRVSCFIWQKPGSQLWLWEYYLLTFARPSILLEKLEFRVLCFLGLLTTCLTEISLSRFLERNLPCNLSSMECPKGLSWGVDCSQYMLMTCLNLYLMVTSICLLMTPQSIPVVRIQTWSSLHSYVFYLFYTYGAHPTDLLLKNQRLKQW